eukprot:jgi/Chlat1/5538/Chrsp369S00841
MGGSVVEGALARCSRQQQQQQMCGRDDMEPTSTGAASSPSAQAATSAFVDLDSVPDDILFRVLLHLKAKDLAACACVSRRLRDCCVSERRLWSPLCRQLWGVKTNVAAWGAPSYRHLYQVLTRYAPLVGVWRAVGDTPQGALVLVEWREDHIAASKLAPSSGHAMLRETFFSISATPEHSVTFAETSHAPESVLTQDAALLPAPVVSIIDKNHWVLEHPQRPPSRSPERAEAAVAAAGLAHAWQSLEIVSGGRMPGVSASPPGSFSHEFCRFLTERVASPGASRRRRQSRSGRESPGPVVQHFVRIVVVPPSVEGPLQGLWRGVYGRHGLQVVSIKYNPDGRIICTKVTGDAIVPAGEISWHASPSACDCFADFEDEVVDSQHIAAYNGETTVEREIRSCHTAQGQVHAARSVAKAQWTSGRLWEFRDGGIAFAFLGDSNLIVEYRKLELNCAEFEAPSHSLL